MGTTQTQTHTQLLCGEHPSLTVLPLLSGPDIQRDEGGLNLELFLLREQVSGVEWKKCGVRMWVTEVH